MYLFSILQKMKSGKKTLFVLKISSTMKANIPHYKDKSSNMWKPKHQMSQGNVKIKDLKRQNMQHVVKKKLNDRVHNLQKCKTKDV